jgi:hypothetical protein
MKRSLFIIPFILLFGCSGQHKKLNKIIEKSTKVEVFVFEKGTGQNGIKAFESNDPSRIKEFKNYFTNKHAPSFKYSYTGKFVFTYGKKDINVMFNMSPESTHIAYMIDYNLYTMKLSEKGMEFLKTVTTNLPIPTIEQNKGNNSEQTD